MTWSTNCCRSFDDNPFIIRRRWTYLRGRFSSAISFASRITFLNFLLALFAIYSSENGFFEIA